mgnify:FL=1|jgi:hypothetical protein
MQLVVVFEVVFVSLWVVDDGGGGHGSLTTCVLVLDAGSIGWMLCRPGDAIHVEPDRESCLPHSVRRPRRKWVSPG